MFRQQELGRFVPVRTMFPSVLHQAIHVVHIRIQSVAVTVREVKMRTHQLGCRYTFAQLSHRKTWPFFLSVCMLGGGSASTSMTVPPGKSSESKSNSGGESVDEDWWEGMEAEEAEVLRE